MINQYKGKPVDEYLVNELGEDIDGFIYGDLVHFDGIPHIKPNEVIFRGIDQPTFLEVTPETVGKYIKVDTVADQKVMKRFNAF